ncbi:MAG: site-specific DNA-methyltransferase [Mycobacterium sp.]
MGRVIECLDSASGENWMAYNGDCVSVAEQLPDETVGFSVYSPPFQNIFVYSDSEADMGNCTSDDEFNRHYSYLIREKLRITKPGRLTAVHCSDLPSSKWKDGVIGLKDFPGDIVRLHQDAGWIFHSRICIWRDPVVEMTRTKALGLLYKQLKKDSTRSRMGMADYVLVFRKPGDNAEPVGHMPENFPVSQWQKWASPVWMDINQTNTLNVRMAKDNADERHLCPLQLDLIERAVTMWSNPGDVVLSPFMGIGSEGVTALKLKRKFIGIELKPSYFKHACRYLEAQERQEDLFIAELPTMEAAE